MSAPITSHVFINLARVWANEQRAKLELRQEARRKAGLPVLRGNAEQRRWRENLVAFHPSKSRGTVGKPHQGRLTKAEKKWTKRRRMDLLAGRAPF